MPSIEDWINCPLGIVQDLYDSDGDVHTQKVKDYFSKKTAEQNALSWVPSLNSTPLHSVKSQSLVRFRCMIQDMHDPEFYLGVYQVEDLNSGGKTLRSGKYRDLAECRPHQEIKLNSPQNKTMDRQTLYCVPVPGETLWVKQAFTSLNQKKNNPSSSYSGVRNKRSLDEEEESDAVTMDTDSKQSGGGDKGDVIMETQGESSNKKSKTDEEKSAVAPTAPDLNFPLPGEEGIACLVKIYEMDNSYKVNDVVEFIGVLSTDPALVQFPGDNKEGEQSAFEDESGMEVSDAQTHSPPPSLVPRLHAILATRHTHINPHLPADVKHADNKTDVDSILAGAKDIHENLVSVLTQALFGDRLAAEYVLCHLISGVYARSGVVPLGKFCINLSGCHTEGFATRLYSLIQDLVTKSHYLPLALAGMNTAKFVPKKDYSANRLTTGQLQLSDRTHLVVDETAMQPGQLDATGVHNLTALGNVIQWQRVDYDFSFHKQEFACNLPVLVLSEGKSLFSCDCQVPLVPVESTDNLEQRFAAIATFLTPVLLTQLRTYLGLAACLEYGLQEAVQAFVEEDFVQLRKEDANAMTVDHFHQLLVLARLLSLSRGQTTLTRDIWHLAKQLEGERKARLTHAVPNGNS